MPKMNSIGMPLPLEVAMKKQFCSLANRMDKSELSIPDMNNGNRLIYQIVDDIFQQQQCNCKETQSEPTSQYSPRRTQSFVDKRLQYWKNMIRQRRAQQLRLCMSTGRLPEQLLFNTDNREEQSIKRILDYAARKDAATNNFIGASPDYVGIPNRVGLELQGANSTKGARKRADLRNVLDYCPDLDELEVIGKNQWVGQPCERISGHIMEPTVIPEKVVNGSIVCSGISERGKSLAAAASQLAVLINGTTYRRHRPEYSPILERRFVCNPYELSFRTVMRIENNGREIINFRWSRAEFFAYNNTLFNEENEVFVFDTDPFPLSPGGVREVSVLFRPCKVGIVKQRWYLKTHPRIFFRCPCALTLNMHGRCTPPQEYLQLLQQNMEQTLTHNRQSPMLHICQTLQLEPHQSLYPFDRELEESEAFNVRNVGFHCERASDFEGLRSFFERIRPYTTCELKWDYSVSLLIELVCAKQDERLRIELFEELQLLLSQLRGRTVPLKISDAPAKVAQRDRTRFIYVRGLIFSSIELWEQKIWLLAEHALKSTASSDGSQSRRQLVLKHSKYFRDSLYIYTYEHLCNIAENIVSVIESTEHV